MTRPESRTWRCSPSVVRQALDRFLERGGRVEGGESDGRLNISTPLGPLEGRFTFDGDLFTVTLDRRPPMVPLGLIWEELDRICGPPVSLA